MILTAHRMAEKRKEIHMKYKVVLRPAKCSEESSPVSTYYTEAESMEVLEEGLSFFREYGFVVVSVEELGEESAAPEHQPG